MVFWATIKAPGFGLRILRASCFEVLESIMFRRSAMAGFAVGLVSLIIKLCPWGLDMSVIVVVATE